MCTGVLGGQMAECIGAPAAGISLWWDADVCPENGTLNSPATSSGWGILFPNRTFCFPKASGYTAPCQIKQLERIGQRPCPSGKELLKEHWLPWGKAQKKHQPEDRMELPAQFTQPFTPSPHDPSPSTLHVAGPVSYLPDVRISLCLSDLIFKMGIIKLPTVVRINKSIHLKLSGGLEMQLCDCRHGWKELSV